MIRYVTIAALVVGLVACSGNSGYQPAEDAQDAGRQFIRASLDGNYEKAKFYLLKDDDNLTLLKKQQSNYQKMSSEDKRSFGDASILPLEIQPLNDSVTNYKYNNSFHPKDTTTIRIVRINNEWLVDLKSVIKM
ncbi:hypothetical protein D3H65_17840 [Paraflavitalea soli]|uniref:DUF4878 domain-containing protein n=1 Tax=Paraflavitalea soli TaxID=2315862 RepID=A0A3B7MNK5_9BACT|nr:hypothetical protein [Paraflavitalea soli]AXY75728.1 hypothetical protein D3H65_17840 [Paraflavitalea soli]